MKSIPWIFYLLQAADDNICGAKGVGVFRLAPSEQTGTRLELVPGNHKTLDAVLRIHLSLRFAKIDVRYLSDTAPE